jgi:hypothetical protein
MSGEQWGRAHAAAHDFTDEGDALTVAERYRTAPRWIGYEIAVRSYGEGAARRFWIAARRAD